MKAYKIKTLLHVQGAVIPSISNQGDSVIKVKSLPYDACQLDVLHFFEGFRIRPNGVQLVIQGNNKPSGEVKHHAAVATVKA